MTLLTAPLAATAPTTRVETPIRPRAPHMGLGFDPLSIIGGIASIGGSLLGEVFGGKSESRRYDAELQMTAMTLEHQDNQLTALVGAMESSARIQQEGETDRAYLAVKSMRDQIRGQLSALRQQRYADESRQQAALVQSTQSGMFGLARTGLEQTGASVRRFPTAATMGVVALVGLTLWAASRTGKGKGKGKRRKRRAPAFATSPVMEAA